MAATSAEPNLFKLASALEHDDNVSSNLFASQARPLTSEADFKPSMTPKSKAENEDGTEEGEDITIDIAKGIKRVLYGTRTFTVDQEWKRSSFLRRPIQSAFPYGLLAPKDKPRGLVIAVQAQLIQKLLQGDGTDVLVPEPSVVAARLKLVYDWKQRKLLIDTMADILWRAGRGKRAYVVLLYSAYAGLLYSEEKRLEHFVKTVKVIDCVSHKQLCKVLDKRLNMFEHQDGGGLLMFLYSLILSRTIEQLEIDMQGDHLFTIHDECSLSLVNLIISGSAIPYLFNGVLEYDINSKPLEVPLRGVKERSNIGILIVDRPEGREAKNAKKIMIGSMLKTPLFPVWVLRLKGRYSIFFCCNLNLNRDWRSEAKFTLHFYTGQNEQTEQAKILVDSRLRLKEEKRRRDEKTLHLVDECIQSRWPGAHIDWNGISPFF